MSSSYTSPPPHRQEHVAVSRHLPHRSEHIHMAQKDKIVEKALTSDGNTFEGAEDVSMAEVAQNLGGGLSCA